MSSSSTSPSNTASTTLSATDYERLLEHFNIYDPEHVRIKNEAYAYAREHCPVPFTRNDEGFWMVTRYEDVRQVLLDPGSFSSTGLGPRPVPININPLNVDPPYHTDLRRLLNPLFSRSALSRFEPAMRAIARENIDGWVGRGEVDLVTEFVVPVVGQSLARIAFEGIDTEQMPATAAIVSRVADGDETAFAELLFVAAGYLARREAEGVTAADEGLVPVILNGTVSDGTSGSRPLTDEERLGVLAVMFLGGLDTTRGAIGSIAYYAALDPSLEDRIRDPEWVKRDMDEFLRLITPTATLARTVTREVEVGGRAMKPGDRVLVVYDSANRDRCRFADPDRLDFDNPRPSNMAFGLGIHRCLGLNVARIQIEIAFDELYRRITRLRLGRGEVRWGIGVTNGPDRLPLEFDAL